jgi:hypothetical protein
MNRYQVSPHYTEPSSPYDHDDPVAPDHPRMCICSDCDEREHQADVNEAARAAAIDAGELCPDCGAIDIKATSTGPRLAIPLFECRECGTCWFDCVTRPTVEAQEAA